MGLTGAAVGFNNALQQALAERYAQQQAQQQYADHLRQQQFENDMRVQQFQSNEELKKAQLAATEESRKATADNQRFGQANTLGDQLPEGTRLAENDPGVGIMQSGGRGSLLQPVDERPEVTTGPLLPGDTGATLPKGFIKTASAKQIDTKTDNERQAKAEAEKEAHDRKMEELAANRPQGASPDVGWSLQQVTGPDGKLGWARINSRTGEVKPVDTGGITPKPNATTASRLDSAQAVQQTGADILTKLADPKVAATLGPVMGRYNSLQEFLGAPPPELAELAGQIESYALANMGVHGMRSAQGAEKIKQLLSAKHTPESLAATIRGLNQFSQHFLDNAGRGTPKGESKQNDPLGIR